MYCKLLAKVVLLDLLPRFNYCTFAAQTALSLYAELVSASEKIPNQVRNKEESPDTTEKHSG